MGPVAGLWPSFIRSGFRRVFGRTWCLRDPRPTKGVCHRSPRSVLVSGRRGGSAYAGGVPVILIVFFGAIGAFFVFVAARIVISIVVDRRQRQAPEVGVGQARSMVGEIVAVSGSTVPGPGGLVAGPRTDEVGVYAVFRDVVREERDHDVATSDGFRTERRWFDDVRQEEERPADGAFGLADPAGEAIWVRADDVDDLPMDRVYSDRTEIPLGAGVFDAYRSVTEHVLRQSVPLVLVGKVRLDDDGRPWLARILHEKIEVREG